jgi:dephospho-CoA kinase
VLVVGLTGGIGSGKSVVSDMFESLGIDIVDADIVAREVVEPGKPALQSIAKQFGDEVLLIDGSLNRQKLRDIIFSDSNAKRWVEMLLHPIIRADILRQLAQANSPYCILVSPLLFETKQHQLCSTTLLIDVPEQLQKQRASSRDNTSEDAIQKIIDAQLPRTDKLKLSNQVIVNDGTLEELKEKVLKQHEAYLKMASDKS